MDAAARQDALPMAIHLQCRRRNSTTVVAHRELARESGKITKRSQTTSVNADLFQIVLGKR
jgi:hypothetical protein